MDRRSEITLTQLQKTFAYRNKGEILGRKPMCKNCIYFMCHFNWAGNYYRCLVDSHEPRSRKQRCTNNCFAAVLDNENVLENPEW